MQKVLLEISQNSKENTCARGAACNFIKKETLAQVFSCEFCKISKNTFFYRTPLVAAFKDYLSVLRTKPLENISLRNIFYLFPEVLILREHLEKL